MVYGKVIIKEKGDLKRQIPLVVIIILLVSASIMLVSAEPALNSILDTLGYTNRTLTTIETFGRGMYEVTLLAEYAGYHLQNNLSWYIVGSSDFNEIFKGPDGNSGLTSPQITKQFTTYYEFGLCMWSPDLSGIRWFSQQSLNSDGEKHVTVYRSDDDPSVFLIGFENLNQGGDMDYQDMIIKLQLLSPVGGVWLPVDKVGFLTPYLGLSVMVSAICAVFGYAKKGKKKKN